MQTAENVSVAKSAPRIAVVMLSLNEAHNMGAVLDNLDGWADEVFLVDSFSKDDTVSIALRRGVHVVQRAFGGFGEQWNFALDKLPISAPWTMKLDPDERLDDTLKREIKAAIAAAAADGFSVNRRLWFMGRPLPVRHSLVRVWRTGSCRFTNVSVNEHPIVGGAICQLGGEIEHHDSPDLDHWLEKQNRYTTAEALAAYRGDGLAVAPKLFGDAMQRRMWLKRHFRKLPFRYSLLFGYHYLVLGAWRAGWVGYAWAKLRCDVYRLIDYKLREMRMTAHEPVARAHGAGASDPRVEQY